MTYSPYTSDQLDDLVLNILDIALLLREMSSVAKKNNINEIPIHDKKAIQWCDNLEQWARKSKMNLDLLVADSPQNT